MPKLTCFSWRTLCLYETWRHQSHGQCLNLRAATKHQSVISTPSLSFLIYKMKAAGVSDLFWPFPILTLPVGRRECWALIKVHFETNQLRSQECRTQPYSEQEEITANMTNKWTGIHSIAWARQLAAIIIKGSFYQTKRQVLSCLFHKWELRLRKAK